MIVIRERKLVDPETVCIERHAIVSARWVADEKSIYITLSREGLSYRLEFATMKDFKEATSDYICFSKNGQYNVLELYCERLY